MLRSVILVPGLTLGMFPFILFGVFVVDSGVSSSSDEITLDSCVLVLSYNWSYKLSSTPIIRDRKGFVSSSLEPLPGLGVSSASSEL